MKNTVLIFTDEIDRSIFKQSIYDLISVNKVYCKIGVEINHKTVLGNRCYEVII